MKHKGFTLLETMVAVTILAIAVTGPLFIASRAIIATQIASQRLTASYLAQEGIEFVRSMRDNEFLSSYQANDPNASTDAWSNFLNNAVTDVNSIKACRGASCTYEPMTGVVAACSSTCAPLYLVPASSMYTEQTTGNTLTPYTRTITAADISGTEEKITATVSWSSHGSVYSVSVSDHLTPWQ